MLIKLSTWLCLEIGLQGEVTACRVTIATLKGWTSSNVGNNRNESKFYSGRNQEQIEVRKYLLFFGAESFVF
jgi:hypothetical protein